MSVESYVSSARNFSLIILVLGYIGWDLGTHHSKRATLLAEARELVTADWVRTTYRTNRILIDAMVAQGSLTEHPESKILTKKKSSSLPNPSVN